MTVTELREYIGKFGMLKTKTSDEGYGKLLHGHLKDMDTKGTAWFIDNDGFGCAYKVSTIESFEPKEFKPLPDKHKGKELVDIGGQIIYKGTTKEYDPKK